MKQFATCLWFDTQAEEALKFYASIFPGSEISTIARYGESGAKMSGQKAGSVMTVMGRIADLDIMGLNGGPIFKFSPSLSLSVNCKDDTEITALWKKISPGGTVRMELQKYPWSEKYGWTTDKFGVDWQLNINPRNEKIVPSLLFVDELFGRGDEALQFYTSVFPNSKVDMIAHDEKTKSVMYAAFNLNGQAFSLMEGQGKHGHKFTHGTSIIVYCETQKEIDAYYEKLSAGGSTEPCGWLQDKFGVSWQIVPRIMQDLMADPKKAEKVMNAMMTNDMKKLDLAKLAAAAAS